MPVGIRDIFSREALKPRPRRPRPQASQAQAPAGGQARKPAAAKPPDTPPSPDATLDELRAQRDRLLEKFTVMQADLGGAFYEMAIRDHVRVDVLTRKAAVLQRVDGELTAAEAALELARTGAAGLCGSCGAPYAHGTRFCAQCGTALDPVVVAA